MTVAELVEKLRALPQDLPVLVKGYEQGWTEPEAPRLQIVHNSGYPKGDVCGEFEDHEGDWCWRCEDEDESSKDKKLKISTVVIDR